MTKTASPTWVNWYSAKSASPRPAITPVDPLPHPETVVTQQIFWRVQARDGAGNSSGFSEIRDFTLDARAPRVPPGLVTDRIDPAISGDTYTPTFSWDADPDVEHYEVSLDGQPFRDIGSGDTTQITGDENVPFGVHHIFRVRALDAIGNVSQAILFFIDAETSGDVPIYTVANDDFLPLGLYNIDIRAQDLLVHQGLPATSDFFVTELVVALIDPSTGLSTFNVTENQSKSILLRIDPKGLSLDELEVSLKYDDTLLSITSIVTGDVTKVAGLVLQDIVIGVTTADFLATFDPRNTKADLATINIQAKSVTTSTATSIEFVTTNTTEARLDGEPLPAILQDAIVTVVNVAPSGGGAPPPAAVNEEPIAIAIVDPTLLDESRSVDFDGSGSVDPDGAIELYNWDFGDGSTAQGDVVTHVYSDDGTFTVTLTVTDDGTPTPATATDTATITDEDSNTIVGYEWDFGDGTTAEGSTQTHAYGDDGTCHRYPDGHR